MSSGPPTPSSSTRPSQFGSRSGRDLRPGVVVMIGLGAAPALLTVAHLLFGANQSAASAWLTAGLGAALLVGIASPLRRGTIELDGVALPLVLFGAVLATAIWSLTSWGPGGAHPAWAWAGIEQGALTVDRSATGLEIVKLLGLASIFVLGAMQAVRRRNAQATVEVIVWIGAAYAAISLVSFLSGTQLAQGGRLSGGFLSANSGGTVFGLLTVLSVALLLRDWKRTAARGLSQRLTGLAVPTAATVLTTVCLLLTASRMGLVATLLATSVLLVWTLAGRRGGRSGIAVASGLLIIVSAVLALGGNDLLWARLGQDDPTLGGRAELFTAHWKAFVASPLFGWGLGSFDVVNMQMMTAETVASLWNSRATHNVYLQWLEEAGLIGALPMFALVGCIVTPAALRARRTGSGQTLLIGLVCANLVVLIHGLTDFALQVPSIAAFWSLLLGLQFGFGQGRGG